MESSPKMLSVCVSLPYLLYKDFVFLLEISFKPDFWHYFRFFGDPNNVLYLNDLYKETKKIANKGL